VYIAEINSVLLFGCKWNQELQLWHGVSMPT